MTGDRQDEFPALPVQHLQRRYQETEEAAGQVP